MLNKLLKQDVVRELKPEDKPLVEAGKAVDFMIMILTVRNGEENIRENYAKFDGTLAILPPSLL